MTYPPPPSNGPEGNGTDARDPYAAPRPPEVPSAASSPPPPPPYGAQGSYAGQIAQPTNTQAVVGFIFAFVFWPVGLVVSILGWMRANRENGNGKGLAIAGTVLSGLAMVGTVLMLFLLGAIGAAVSDDMKTYDYDSSMPAIEETQPGIAPGEKSPTGGGNDVEGKGSDSDAVKLNGLTFKHDLPGEWMLESNDDFFAVLTSQDTPGMYVQFVAIDYATAGMDDKDAPEDFLNAFATGYGDTVGAGELTDTKKKSDNEFEVTYANGTKGFFVFEDKMLKGATVGDVTSSEKPSSELVKAVAGSIP